MFHIVQTIFGKSERFDVIRVFDGKRLFKSLTKSAAEKITEKLNKP